MEINLDVLDNFTQSKYEDLKKDVQRLIKTYQEQDKTRFDLIKQKIKETNGSWDENISLISKNSREEIDISQLLAYEYCLAGEKLTHGKASFEDMLNKLFTSVNKFRIGNPIRGEDDECLYGKSVNDKTAIPVTSKKYRIIMRAGAQHLDYVKNAKLNSAVYIYKKENIERIACDESGHPISLKTDGIDFDNLNNEEQSLLTNLRQTAFHEWTHSLEKDFIEPTHDSIEEEYLGVDGKKYKNYEKINNYVILEDGTKLQEPEYIYGVYKNQDGEEKKGFYYIDEEGIKKGLDTVDFGLVEKTLGKEICISQGLETRLVLPNGKTEMQNIITEGFVEKTAREMVRAIDPEVKDIDEGKYPEYVAMAYQIISSRDVSLGEDSIGQTYADFLMNSSVLKKDLESRIVELDDGKKVDGLHYISDYANSVQKGETPKRSFLRESNMMKICEHLLLGKEEIEKLKNSGIFSMQELDEVAKEKLRSLLMSGKNDVEYVNSKIEEFDSILKEEKSFFEGIPEKLGYVQREKSKVPKTISMQDVISNALDKMSTPEEVNESMTIEENENNVNVVEGETIDGQ